jgi:hypothetical protein
MWGLGRVRGNGSAVARKNLRERNEASCVLMF